MKTKVTDLSGGDPHLQEIAAESGIDHLSYLSCEETIKFEGGEIQTWYDEDSSSPFAWKAFIKGVGTKSGLSREEAVENVRESWEKLQKVIRDFQEN